jgi:hypothetical protein
MNQESISYKALVPYLVYVGLFIGAGFLSGALVHFPMNPIRFGSIGVIGAILFVIASTVNEIYFNKRNFREEGIVKIMLYSLILSVGIGMVSGGVQHFDEEARYASYLIPSGILISFVGYMLKNNIRLGLKKTGLTLGGLVIIAGLIGVGLHGYASLKHESTPHTHAEGAHHDE